MRVTAAPGERRASWACARWRRVAPAAPSERRALMGLCGFAGRSRRRSRILAKHLIGPCVLLALYFTIFLNQLDNL
jgi:hypothetical protein